MNGILAFIYNAMETNYLKQQMILFNYAKTNGYLLMSLINDILDYLSFINDKFHLKDDELDLNELINEVFELIKIGFLL